MQYLLRHVAIGTAQFGQAYGIANTIGQTDPSDVAKILRLASTRGIDTLDTAVDYGNSEKVLGRVGLVGWRVITKLPAVPDGANIAAWVRCQIYGSLKRLGVERLDGVLLHRPCQLSSPVGELLLHELVRLRDSGEINKIGVSIYAPEEVDVILKTASIDLVQAPMSIVDRRMLDSGAAKRLVQAGIELHARSIFLQGLLLLPKEARPKFFDRWLDVFAEWDQWLHATGCSAVSACLRYALHQKFANRVVVGVDSSAQLEEMFNADLAPLESLPKWQMPLDQELITPPAWEI